jgi:putative transcriptional regulator
MRNRLDKLRADKGWSQQKLADELGVSRQTVNAIEKGRYDPSLPLAFDIARLFHCAIEDVFIPEKRVPPDPTAAEVLADAAGVVEAQLAKAGAGDAA